MPVNLIVVGFGLGSFEFNALLSHSISKEQGQLFYFDKFTDDEMENRIKRIPPELNSFDNNNSYFFNLSVVDKTSEDSLTNIFFQLWNLIESHFKDEFMPKGLARHIIIHELFNPIAGTLLTTDHAAKSNQKDNQKNYFRDRTFVELGLEISNNNDGIINLHQLSQSRVGKYFSLLKNFNSDVNLFHFLKSLGLREYKEYSEGTWYFNTEDPNFKKSIQRKVIRNLSVSIKEKLTEQKTNLKLTDAIKTVESNNTLYLTVQNDYADNQLSIFQNLTEEDFLNTDIKWIYTYRKYFMDEDYKDNWKILLSVTESGGNLTSDIIRDTLNNKKVLLICAYNSEVGKAKRRNQLLEGKLSPIRNSLLKNEGVEELRLLPFRSHNQHMVIFANIDANSKRIVPYKGIYHTRNAMAKRVNPLHITHEEDLKSLLKVFFDYWDRSCKEETIRTDQIKNPDGIKSSRSVQELESEIVNLFLKG